MTYDITDKLQHYFAGTNTPNINDLLLSQDNINLTLAIMQVHASCCPFTQSLLFNFTVLIKKLQVNRSVTLPQFLTSLPKLCQINLNIQVVALMCLHALVLHAY